MAEVGEGDTLVVWRLDRMGRSLAHLAHLAHLVQLVAELAERGVHFERIR